MKSLLTIITERSVSIITVDDDVQYEVGVRERKMSPDGTE